METPQEFSARAAGLLAEAQRLSDATPDSDLSEWLELAKRNGMTWVESLEFAFQRMLAKDANSTTFAMPSRS